MDYINALMPLFQIIFFYIFMLLIKKNFKYINNYIKKYISLILFIISIYYIIIDRQYIYKNMLMALFAIIFFINTFKDENLRKHISGKSK
jgi:hypothetical protein